MNNAIKISGSLSLPVEISGRRTAIFGLSGSGKSNTASVIVEGLLHAGEQVVFIDPKGEAWGCLSLPNGKPSNLDLIIFGEPNGHIAALNESHGPRLADFVFESGRSVALSLLGFESDQAERRFVATFLRQLYRRKTKSPKKSRTLVVFDEAHLFVPESSGRGFKGEQADLSGAVQRIARQGRTFGLGSLFVDQRPQDVAKRVISQVDTIICHQLTHKTDRDALSDWVKGYDRDGRGKTFLDSLASLQPGEAWIWSPSWLGIFQRIKANLRRTYDSGAAPDGSAAAKAVQRAKIDLDALRGQMAEIVEKAKADDPNELRKKIADLERQLRSKGTPMADSGAVDLAVKIALAASNKEWSTVLKQRDMIAGKLCGRLTKIGELAQLNGEAVPGPLPEIAKIIPLTQAQSQDRSRVTEHKPETVPKSRANYAHSDTALGKGGDYRILVALAQNPDGADYKKVALLAGLSNSSGSFSTYLSTLRGLDFITGDRSCLCITSAGVAAVGDFKPMPVGEALVEYWRNRLGDGGKRRIFDAAVQTYPNPLSREGLSEATGLSCTSGSFSTYLSELRTLGLITGSSQIKASDVFFH